MGKNNIVPTQTTYHKTGRENASEPKSAKWYPRLRHAQEAEQANILSHTTLQLTMLLTLLQHCDEAQTAYPKAKTGLQQFGATPRRMLTFPILNYT